MPSKCWALLRDPVERMYMVPQLPTVAAVGPHHMVAAIVMTVVVNITFIIVIFIIIIHRSRSLSRGEDA